MGLQNQARQSWEHQIYRARIVAQGFSQRPGIDYLETFAPVAKIESVRILLAIAAILDWEVHIIDVDSAFLNSELPPDQEVFLEQPPGYVVEGKEDSWESGYHKLLLRLQRTPLCPRLRIHLLHLRLPSSSRSTVVVIVTIATIMAVIAVSIYCRRLRVHPRLHRCRFRRHHSLSYPPSSVHGCCLYTLPLSPCYCLCPLSCRCCTLFSHI
jgi:hypothetical protein